MHNSNLAQKKYAENTNNVTYLEMLHPTRGLSMSKRELKETEKIWKQKNLDCVGAKTKVT